MTTTQEKALALRTALQTSSILHHLADALNDYGAYIRELRDGGATAIDVDEARRELGDALDGIPTFGGEAPAKARGVWSWDATHLLVGEGTGEFEVVPRPPAIAIWQGEERNRRFLLKGINGELPDDEDVQELLEETLGRKVASVGYIRVEVEGALYKWAEL